MPTLDEARLAPARELSTVGQYYQERSQDALNDLIKMYQQEQAYPWEQVARYNAILGQAGAFGGTQAGTQTTPINTPSTLQRLFGGAAAAPALVARSADCRRRHWRAWRRPARAALMPLGSWYSQLPAFGWFDPEDRPGSAAYQVRGRSIPDSQQGIALPTRGGLGKWYNVTPPGSDKPFPLQQTDIGPAKWTGRGVDISAAGAHQMGYSPKNFPTDANFKVEPIDLTGLGLAAGYMGGVPGDNTTAVAAGPREGRKMPTSLMDMFNPRDPAGEPASFADALASRSNSLIGGAGHAAAIQSAARPEHMGQCPGGLSGRRRLDARTAQALAARRQHAEDRRQVQSNFERTFARSGESDFAKIARDLNLTPGTPEFIDQARKYALNKLEGGWETKDIIDPTDPDGERKITVQYNTRSGEYRRPSLPGQTGTAAAPTINWSEGAANAPVYGAGQGGYSAAPQAAAPAADRHAITLPNGEVVRPPPGLSKDARKAWATDVAKTAADMQTGKMTESQATKAIHATGMELAQRELKTLESQGTSQKGKTLASVPWGLGTYFQSSEYQNYRIAKDAWLNAKLRAESGATINPDEFARDDRIFFPQPGENEEQVRAKAVLREHITNNMKRAGGPGYQSPPPLAGKPTPTAPGAGKIPPPPPGFNMVP